MAAASPRLASATRCAAGVNAAEADAKALGLALRGQDAQDEECEVLDADVHDDDHSTPLDVWESLDTDETFESLCEWANSGSWHQGRGGGNPHPERARAGGSAARVNDLTTFFWTDVLADCNSYHNETFHKCPFGGHCRSKIGSEWYNHDFRTYRLDAISLRAHFHAMTTEEREDIVRGVVEIEQICDQGATAHVGTVGVCTAAYAWLNGWSSYIYKRVRSKVRNPSKDLPDGRHANSGSRDGTSKMKIIAWANDVLPHMGDWKSVPGTTDQETIVMAYVSPEHDLFTIYYKATYNCHVPAHDHVCTSECRGSTKPDHKLAVSMSYFGQVLRGAFGHKHWRASGANFSVEFHDCTVTGRCPTCIRLLVSARAAKKRGDRDTYRAFRKDFDDHQASQFRERVFYRGHMTSAISTWRALYTANYPHNVSGDCMLVYGMDAAATRTFSLGINPGGQRRHSKEELYTGPTIGCKVVACVLNGLHGDDDHTIFVVLPCWVAWDANAMITIIYYIIYEQLLRPFLDKGLLPPTSVGAHSDRGGDEWSAATLVANQFLSRMENLGGVIDQCALVSKHSHCIFDRMLAMMKHHVLVTNNGALTYQGLVDSINSMHGCSAVFLDRALDFKDHMLPSCWEGLHDHREPLWFRHENNELQTRLTAADSWEPVGSITTGSLAADGPTIAPPFVATRVSIGDSAEKCANARANALEAAVNEEKKTRAHIAALVAFAKTADEGVLAVFGNGRYAGDGGRVKLVEELEHMARMVPCACGTHKEPCHIWDKSGEFDLSWPPPWIQGLQQLRAHPGGVTLPPSAEALRAERATAAAQPPQQYHSRVPAVPMDASPTDAQALQPAPCPPANASEVQVGNFHLYYEPTEPKLHVCKVLRFEHEEGMSVAGKIWGTLLSDESPDSAVTVVCQRWDCKAPPPPGTALKLANGESVEWNLASAVWAGQPLSDEYQLRVNPRCLGPKVNLKNKDCTLYKNSVKTYTDALRSLAADLESEDT